MIIDKIIIHSSATKPSMDIGAHEIDQWHKDRGWSGVGYHFIIRQNGVIERGRKVGQLGAHARGYNTNSVGICLVGGLDENGKPSSDYTDGQRDSLAHLVRDLKWVLDIESKNIVGHRDLPGVNKDCPCFDVEQWMKTGEFTGAEK